jgi:hypothetical protein
MKRASLFICIIVLLASMLACSLSSLTGPRMIVTLAPASGNTWDDTSKALARDVILNRLKYFGVNGATASVSPNGNLEINLPASANVESVAPLLTHMGVITFVDSTSPFSEGDFIDSNLKIIFTGRNIKSAEVITDSVGQYQIAITLTPEGSQKLADYTGNNVNHYLVIVRDGIVISSPRVNSAITGGKAIIQGDFTQDSASMLAAQLISGALLFPLVILDSTTK